MTKFGLHWGIINMKKERTKVTLVVVLMLICGMVYSKAYHSDALEMKQTLHTIPQNSNKQETEHTTNVININDAEKEELMLLDGIGETMAERIIAYRQEKGMFENILEIQNVKGIGEKTYAEIAPYITVN